MRGIRKSPSVIAAIAVLVIVSSAAAFEGSFAVAQIAEPAAQASKEPVSQAQSSAACTADRKRRLQRAVAKYKRAMPAQRRRYFRSHPSAKQRKAFVKRQRAKLKLLQRRAQQCVAGGPAPSPTPPPAPAPAPGPAPEPAPSPAPGDDTPPSLPQLEAKAGANAVLDGAKIWYRPGARAAFSLAATASDAESAIAGVTFPDLGGRWTGGGVMSAPPYETAYELVPEPLDAKVTDGAMSLTRADGGPLGGEIAPGPYEIRVDDESASEGFRLFGPGVSEATSEEFQGEASWSVALRPGKTYRFQSDAGTDQLKGEFATGAAYTEPGTKGVTALNGAGLTSPEAALHVRADASAPETAISCDGASCTLSATDAESGVEGIRYTLDGTLPSADHGTRYSGPFDVSATTTVRFVAFDRVGNVEQLREELVSRPEPEDTLVAPPLDPGVPFNFADGTEFLYSGPNPVQTGVAPGTIAARRVAVIRGRVVNRAGEPLPNVKVSVLDHPELGQTLTRAGGHFDLAVNGGGRLTIDFEREGLISVQRQVDTNWQDFAHVDDVVMLGYDSRVTEIDLDSAAPIQTARGTEQADLDGERQATVMFRAGTEATMTLEDGSKVPLEKLHVRATEYTVGARGEDAMPADLPATTGYTYAVELSVDEAREAGAKRVDFSKPVAFYLENFLDFNVGSVVPVGYYDRERGAWLPSKNGRVVGVAGEADGKAQLDLDGDGTADPELYDEHGVTDAELAEVAALYGAGQSMWRVQLTHFTPVDCNWLGRRLPRVPNPNDPDGDGEPDDRPEPDVEDPQNAEESTDGDCEQPGSIIGCENRVLGQAVGITGTPFRLFYGSDRVPGRKAEAALQIPLSGGSVPDGLKRIDVHVTVAGAVYSRSFPPSANQTYDFVWDGEGAYNRQMTGAAPASVHVSYVYPTYRQQVIDDLVAEGERAKVELSMFARVIDRRLYEELDTGIDSWAAATRELGRAETSAPKQWQSFVRQDGRGALGVWDARGAGLGGWTLDVHHTYDGVRRQVQLGDGGTRSAVGIRQVVQTIAGNEECDHSGDGGPAKDAKLCGPNIGAVAPDGTVYLIDTRYVRKITPDGLIHHVAGSGICDGADEGEPATEAGLCSPHDLDVADDGTILLVDNGAVYRIATDGRIHLVAGRGHSSFGARGGPATEARFESIGGIAAGSNGGLYVSDQGTGLLHYVGPDGWISAIAGDRDRCEVGQLRAGAAAAAAETPTTADQVCADGDVAEGPDGSIYAVSYPGIVRIRPDGIVTRFAGRAHDAEPAPRDEDGIPATEALVDSGGIAVDGNGAVYVAEGQRVRRIGQDGIITTVAGEPPNVEVPVDAPDEGFATADRLLNADSVAVAPDGTLYLPDGERVRKVTSPLGGLADRPISVPSPDGGELWQFDRRGRHLRTLDAITGATIWDFEYDDAGRLVGVKDRSGRTTTIERGGNGEPLAIVAPGGQRTELTLRGDGWLERIENPEHEAVTVDYTTSGLLRTFTNGEDETSTYEYDGLGRLRTASDAEGGEKTLSTATTEFSSTIRLTTKQGRTTKYVLSRTQDGVTTREMHYSGGSSVTSKTRADGNRETTYSDGTKEVVEYGPDPRFGMLAPMVTKTTVTVPSGLSSTVETSREVTLVNDDPVDGLATVTDTRVINGDAYVRTYDRAARTLTLTSPEGRKNVTKLDALGRAIEVSQGPGRAPVVTTYDELGRVERIEQGDQFWSYAYFGDTDHVRSRTDARDKTTSYVRDGVGRPTKITLPSGREYDMVYDDAGRLLTTAMPSEEGEPRPQHGFTYSDAGRTEAYTAPGGAQYLTEWSLDGENEGTTLPGRATKHDYTWGAAGRMQELSYGEATVGFGHDTAGRMTGVSRTAAGGSEQALSFGYDGVLQTSATASGPASGQFAYEWTPDHELSKLTLDGTVVHSVTRDDDGLVTGYGPFTFARTGPSGEATGITGAGHSIALGFDDAGKLENRTHTRLSQFYDLDLVYDGSGRIQSRTERVGADPAKTLVYSYDDDGRLVEVRTPAGELVEQYAYDARGNRKSAKAGSAEAQLASYGADDRLLSRGGVSYTHDAAGFLTERGQDTFDYSARGELLRANAGGKEVTYAYDGMGRRTARTTGGTTTQYLYGSPDDPFQLTATKQGGTLTEYFYDDFGNVFAYRRGAAVFFVATDQVGSPRVVVNASGQRVRTIEYDSFGNVVATSGAEPAPAIGFAGGLADPDTGLVRFGMRDYDPAAGRWTAKNPLLFEGVAANLYAYAGSNPVNLTDRTGLPSIGASAGVGGYLGVKLGWNDKGFSFCWEFGVGIGGSVEVDPFTETLDEGVRYVAEGQVGVGPAVRGTIGYEYDPLGGPCAEGTGEWKGKGCVVVICAGSDGATVEHPGPDIPKDLGQSIKDLMRGGVKGVSAQAKAAVRVCRGGTWD